MHAGIWGLMQPAKVTSACDDLADAINELRLGKSHGDATVRLPTDAEILRITHLRNYVRDLNRGRGMGFVMSNKRISYSYVLSMTMRAASAMPFFFAIMLSFNTEDQLLEAEDKMLANATARGCCPC